MNNASAPRIVLGVAGGIAAYKSCELLRLLSESGHQVQVVPTASALRFVGEATWAALSGRPVAERVWDSVHDVPHVRIGRQADLLIVAPATADLMAKAAHGLADDLLTNTLLTARCPVMFAPAMHTEMWQHPATQDNVAVLRSRGAVVLDPATGRLTGADTGPGRMPEPAELAAAARRLLRRGAVPPDLSGRSVLITAGGTREPLDPVRFLGNRSSGRQGYALAATAAERGAQVHLVAASSALPDPAGVQVEHVETAREMRESVFAALQSGAAVDAVAMAAAVSDFRPETLAAGKIKKSGTAPAPLRLVENPDILAELTRSRDAGGPAAEVIVGFAAETDDVRRNGELKLRRKGCDLLVVNQVGQGLGFATPDNQAVVLGADGSEVDIPHGPKEELADRVWDLVAKRFSGPRRQHGG